MSVFLDTLRRPEETSFIEQAVVGQECLPGNAAHRAVFKQGGGDQEPVVVRLLDEADHDRHFSGKLCQLLQARVGATHGDLGVELLQEIAGQTQLWEDEQVDGLRPSIRDYLGVARQIRLQLPEPGRDLGQPDTQGRHCRGV